MREHEKPTKQSLDNRRQRAHKKQVLLEQKFKEAEQDLEPRDINGTITIKQGTSCSHMTK